MEDLGAEYFHELVSRSFFQKCGNHETRFVMHDLITDLAQSVARRVSINLEDKLEHNKNYTILQDTQHVSYNHWYRETFKNFEAFKEAEHLRTFLALPIDQDYPYGLGCYLTSKVFYD